MSRDDLAERLDAVERRLDAAYPEPADDAVNSEAIERVERFAERLADLEAAVEAVEGYVGEIERVDDQLEQRADAAIAAVDGLEDRTEAVENRTDSVRDRTETVEDRVDAVEDRLRTVAAPDDGLEARLDRQAATLEEVRSDIDELDEHVAGSGATTTDGGGGFSDATEQAVDAEPGIGSRSVPGTATSTASERDPMDSFGTGPIEGTPGGSANGSRSEAGRGTGSGAGRGTDPNSCSECGATGPQSAGTLDADRRGETGGVDEDRATDAHRSGQSQGEERRGPNRRTATPGDAGLAAAPDGGDAVRESPGREGGRRTARRSSREGDPNGGAGVSGWGDPSDGDPSAGRRSGRRPGGSTADADDESSWTGGSAETLLDRLRTML